MPSQIPTPVHANENPNVGGRRNPYEMRFDLLHLAQSILETNAHMAREDKDKDTENPHQTFYTTEEVISTAQRLNEFVSHSK